MSETRLNVWFAAPWISKQRAGETVPGVEPDLSNRGTVNSGSPITVSLFRRPG